VITTLLILDQVPYTVHNHPMALGTISQANTTLHNIFVASKCGACFLLGDKVLITTLLARAMHMTQVNTIFPCFFVASKFRAQIF
jgi:hypothetical protein